MAPSLRILAAALLLFTALSSATANSDNVEYYCGLDWVNAADYCHLHCPTGDDVECSAELGEGYGCYMFTGCDERLAEIAAANNAADPTPPPATGAAVVNNNYCGKSWIYAMLQCSDECPGGFECGAEGERCFAATNCDVPLQTLVSNIMTTLSGPDTAMEGDDIAIFSDTVWETIAAVAAELGVSLAGVDVGEQTSVDRRELQHRMERRRLMGHEKYLHWDLGNNMTITQRMLPSGSSAIDVSMVVTGDYRPPPYADLDAIAEDSINRNGAKVVNTLRERGSRAGRDFFNRVEGIEAVRAEDKTQRPTRSPVESPTGSPAAPPTGRPSGFPSTSPSSMPSSVPSRALDQVIMTGNREDLMLETQTTTSSYGYVFNIRTKPTSGVVIMTGFDFYTKSTEDINFELWSRLGSFVDYKGTYDGWDLVGEGTIKGRGLMRYTSIPEDMFTPVSIPGGGGEEGTRAFYLTLNTMDLVYKTGERGGGSDEKPHAETDDIEVWEGEGVLFYPFPDPEDKFFYRYPRQYLGAIYYDRLPCRPFSLYGRVDDFPCPLVPTGAPTVPPPTMSPVTDSPTTPIPTVSPSRTPTSNPASGTTPAPQEPTKFPTLSPTESKLPTMYPTTAEPSFSPVVPMRSNIIITLRNIPKRQMTDREEKKLLQILESFLRRHTDSSMVLAGIDYWHGQLIEVDVKEGWVAPKKEGDDDDPAASQVARGRESNRLANRLLQRKKKPVEIPQIAAIDVTLILKITMSNLPPNLLGNLAVVALHEHAEEFMELLHEQQAFFSFFRDVDGVFARTLDDDLTNPPSVSPTTLEYKLRMEAEMEAGPMVLVVDESDGRAGFGLFVVLGIGFLWCCLTAISIAYLMGARGEMEEQRDMENLLKAEKVNPLDEDSNEEEDNADDFDAKSMKSGKSRKSGKSLRSSKGGKNLHRSSTVPLGHDDDDDADTIEGHDLDNSAVWDHTKNGRLALKTRVEMGKSLTKSMTKDDAQDGSSKGGDTWDHAKNNRLSFNSRVELSSKPAATVNKKDDPSLDVSDLSLTSAAAVNHSYVPARKHDARGGRDGRAMGMKSTVVKSEADVGAFARAGDGQTKRRQSAGPKAMEGSVTASLKKKRDFKKSLTDIDDASTSMLSKIYESESGTAPSKRGMARQLSQSMVVPKTDITALEQDMAKHEQKVLKDSMRRSSAGLTTTTSRAKGGHRAFAKSMVAPRGGTVEGDNSGGGAMRRHSARTNQRNSLKKASSSNSSQGGASVMDDLISTTSGLRRSSTAHNSSDNLHSLRRSSGRGSSDNLRRSSVRHGSSDNLASGISGLRRSTATSGSSDNLAGLRRSSRKGSNGDLAKLGNRSSNTSGGGGRGSSSPGLSRSGTELKKPPRRRSGTMGRSMIV